jgi:type II secretion system protein H
MPRQPASSTLPQLSTGNPQSFPVLGLDFTRKSLSRKAFLIGTELVPAPVTIMRLAIRNSMKNTKARAGFTLIEAFVVLIIVGLVASMVMPNWGKLGLSTKANAAAGVVQSDLQRMFSEAQKNKRPVRLVVSPNNRRYTVTDRATGAVMWTRYFMGATNTTTVEYQLTLMRANGGSSNVTVDVFPNGLASAGIVIEVSVRSETRTVTMTRVGHIRIS